MPIYKTESLPFSSSSSLLVSNPPFSSSTSADQISAGVIAQTQPKFIANRDIFEAREKKAKLYSWWAFCFGEIVAEVPYLLVCALLYFAPWYVITESFNHGLR
jgi:ABC-type multidrug transport system permease subunit